MATSNNTEEAAAKAVQKRYEGLVMVRTKAIKGKGAWYWSHLEPILVHNSDTNLPKAVKLKCGLCDSVFSASNPSRTASEHLKRGTCPNFNSFVSKPVSSISPSGSTPSPVVQSPAPLSLASPQHRSGKKRNSSFSGRTNSSSHQVQPLAVVDASRFSVEVAYSPVALGGGGGGVYGQHNQFSQPQQQVQQQQHLILSGGKEDLGALAMFEDSVKKLKSPKASTPNLSLNKIQLERRDFSHDDDNDAEFLSVANGEDDALNESFVDASSVFFRGFKGGREGTPDAEQFNIQLLRHIRILAITNFFRIMSLPIIFPSVKTENVVDMQGSCGVNNTL
ncbi:hypothetical protein ACET3Z_005631 [Daucus carota]